MKVRTRTQELVATAVSLVFLLGIAGLVQSAAPSSVRIASSELGFTSLSPNGVFGGSIVPASCESGLGEGGVSHGGGDTSGNCYVGNACAPNPNPSGYGTTCASSPNSCGQTQSNGTIQCNGSCSSTPPLNTACAPTALLSASPNTIDSGQSSTLTWSSTNATFCIAAGGFSTGNATSGNASTGALSSTQNYQINCTGTYGSTNSNIVTVTVRIPTVELSVAPDRVPNGGSTTVSWNATNVNGCTITRNGTTWQTLAAGPSRTVVGSAPDTVTVQTSYAITCTNNASATAALATQIVNIVSAFQEF